MKSISKKYTSRGILLLILILGTTTMSIKAQSTASSGNKLKDILQDIPADRIRINGYLGEKLNLCIKNRIEAQNTEELIEPFKKRTETMLWQTDFLGKWIMSAISAYDYNRQSGLRKIIDKSVKDLLATQSADGYIGNYADTAHLGDWDIWGRKVTLLGLMAYYDLTGDKSPLDAARRLANHLLTEVGPGKVNIIKTGIYRGMASSSVLEPMVLLYNRTGDQRYLDFAKYIVAQWETPDGPQLISKALNGIAVADRFPHPKQWGSWENGQKAYEMMSCYIGLLELYRITGEPTYLQAVEMAVKNIVETEINIVGSGSATECWYHGKERETQPAYQMMETCVTVTWMKLCMNLLRLTGKPFYADQIEISTYNALIGSMTTDGSSFAMYSPIEGNRELSKGQCGMNINCCTANGPRGFMLLPEFSFMSGNNSLYINLYGESKMTYSISAENNVIIEQLTAYPISDLITIKVTPTKPENFEIALRIPAWSENTQISVNGEITGSVLPGNYAHLKRNWQKGDKIILKLDLRGRLITKGAYSAIMRGPIVLARDTRFADGFVDEAGIPQINNGFIPLVNEAGNKSDRIYMSFSAPLVMGGTNPYGKVIVKFCDFASAGNDWRHTSRYRVWIPQPFDAVNTPTGQSK